MIEIRHASEGDLDGLGEHIKPPRRLHADRLAAQEAGRAVYFTAWHDGLPAGHVLLKWDAEMLSRHGLEHGCAELEDLLVSLPQRNRGVGRQLLQAVEVEARRRGLSGLGLGVGVHPDYGAARHLYAEAGYVDAGHGTFWQSWTVVDRDGVAHEGGDDLTYLLKTLTL